MWVMLLYAVSCCIYGSLLFAAWWQRLPDVGFAILAGWGLARLAGLVVPRHSQGPLLGAALVLLTPQALLLPFTHRLAPAWFFSAAAALLAAKIYLRDGPKTSSLLLLGICLGIGLAYHPPFVVVLPWALIPVWAATSGRAGFARTQALLLAVAAGTWLIAREYPLPEPLTGAAHAALRPFLSGTGLASGLNCWPAAALFSAALLTAGGGFLAGLFQRGRSQGEFPASRQLPLQWNSPRRLAPLFEAQLLTGLATLAAWITAGALLDIRPPGMADLFLLAPPAVIAASLGFANAADAVRRHRRIPNWVAEHIAAWGLLLFSAANLLCLLKLAR